MRGGRGERWAGGLKLLLAFDMKIKQPRIPKLRRRAPVVGNKASREEENKQNSYPTAEREAVTEGAATPPLRKSSTPPPAAARPTFQYLPDTAASLFCCHGLGSHLLGHGAITGQAGVRRVSDQQR